MIIIQQLYIKNNITSLSDHTFCQNYVLIDRKTNFSTRIISHIEKLRYICSVERILTLPEVEKISKALGDPYRLQIMEMVKKQKDWTQCVMIVDTIDLAQSTISHHLKQLTDAGLLLADKDGRNMKFSINTDLLKAYTNFLSKLGS